MASFNDVNSWYQQYLQQVAAESYLDQTFPSADPALYGGSGDKTLDAVLRAGNGNLAFEGKNDPSYTKLTIQQIEEFKSKFEIVAHHANDASGFSGTCSAVKAMMNCRAISCGR